MRLSDIMSAMDLAVYPQVGLVIFLGVFLAVTARTLRGSCREEFRRQSAMPLEPEQCGADARPGRGANP